MLCAAAPVPGVQGRANLNNRLRGFAGIGTAVRKRQVDLQSLRLHAPKCWLTSRKKGLSVGPGQGRQTLVTAVKEADSLCLKSGQRVLAHIFLVTNAPSDRSRNMTYIIQKVVKHVRHRIIIQTKL